MEEKISIPSSTTQKQTHLAGRVKKNQSTKYKFLVDRKNPDEYLAFKD